MPKHKLEDQRRRHQTGTRRKIFFSLVVLVLAFLPWILLELILILSGWQGETRWGSEVRDPFIGFSGEQSLFELSSDGQEYRIRESRLGYFRPASFLAEKPENGFRVFVVGGSTVQGRPWETETAFSKWLELGLIACEPDSAIEVINCGGVSYASYRLSHVIDEIVDYSPDLVLLCTGHNEFLEQRTYPTENKLPGVVLTMHRWLSTSRSYRWLRSQVLRIRKTHAEGPVLKEDIITRLDYRNGLKLFTESSLQRETVLNHFEFNLRKMVSTVVSRNIRLMVLTPPANQKDCFPFKPRPGWRTGDASPYANSSLEELKSIRASDQTADFFYFRGMCHFKVGKNVEAKKDFSQAIDRDICPIRMTSNLRETTHKVVRQLRKTSGHDPMLFIDLNEKCESESGRGIIGDELLVDHVHPSIQTHKKIANWILELLQKNNLVRQNDGWQSKFESLASSHHQSLGFGYFQRGKERLESVLKWSRGQASNPFDEPAQ